MHESEDHDERELHALLAAKDAEIAVVRKERDEVLEYISRCTGLTKDRLLKEARRALSEVKP